MSIVRFATARAVLEAFPEVSQEIGVAPDDEQSPIKFIRELVAAGKLAEGVTFCAYLLPRREAVWWACISARTLAEDIARERPDALLAAEAWVYQPDDQRRLCALEIGTRGDRKNPVTWLALAAGWSGGSKVSGAQQLPIPAFMTARASRIAVLLSASRLRRAERILRSQSCITEAIKLADAGLG